MNCAGQVKIVGDKLHLSSGQVEFSCLFLTLLQPIMVATNNG